MKLPPEYGDVATDFRFLIEANASGEHRRIAIYLALILDYEAASEYGHVAGHMAAHAHAAAEASYIAHFFVGSDDDVVPELGAAVRSIGEGYRRKSCAKEQTRK